MQYMYCGPGSAGTAGAAARVIVGWHAGSVPGSWPPAAERTRRGMDAAAARPFGQSVERSFYCRSCRLTARGRWVPAGWYVLERAAGGGARHLRAGLYCSLDCLAAAGSDLAAAEQDATARRGLPAEAARDRARLVEIAQTLLHQGATIRAAGDELGVATSTLRHWLREAGVRVGADGTLTGSAAPPLPPSGPDARRCVTEKGLLARAGRSRTPGRGPPQRSALARRRPSLRPPAGHRSRRSTSWLRPGTSPSWRGRVRRKAPLTSRCSSAR
jgi:transposase-like protein